ncbi:2,3-bisphosphoglycerate-dependent phosphoglycerate mutase 2-like protein [Tanacetum coccineum]
MVVHSGQMKALEFLADIVESVAVTMFPGTTTNETSPLEPHQNHDRSARPKVARSDSAIYHDGGHKEESNKAIAEARIKWEAATVLVMHGEPLWNENILFTGCVDVSLATKGMEEAVKVGDRISNIPVGMIYTSTVIRAQMSGMLAMTQEHRSKRFMFNPLLSGVVGAGLAWCRIHERLLWTSEDFVWPVDSTIHGRFIIDVEFPNLLRKQAQYGQMTECCDHQQVKAFSGAFLACFTSQSMSMSPSTQVKELQKLTK